ncbi:MAG: hypothetical protein H7Z37_10080 [Pyrinomonadaceae bacterium]|nr:hypothetical protein [Pyrinomonadaceae bacterium]
MASRNLFLLKVLFVIMVCTANAFAQNQFDNDVKANDEQPQTSQAEKFDEFGRLNECAKSARLDNLSISLQNDPTKTAHIIFYRTEDALPSQFNSDKYASNYLIQNRGIEPNRVTEIFGGFRETQMTELWLLPKGAESPKPSNTIAPPKLPKDKTYLYDRKLIELYDSNDLYLPQILARFEKIEQEADQIDATMALTKGNQDSTEKQNSIVSDEERESLRFGWTDENFARQIKTTKDARGVIIFYADDSTLDISKTHHFFQQGAERMTRAATLNVEQIQVVFGGFSNHEMRVEMFIVPKNGETPIATPEEKLTENESESEETENPE